MAERMTIDELKSYLWQSAVLLRTNIDAGAYKQYIFPLMFFKRICDVYDEETEKALAEYGDDIDLYPEEELHTFIVPKGHHWNDVRQVTEDVGRAIVPEVFGQHGYHDTIRRQRPDHCSIRSELICRYNWKMAMFRPTR